MEKSVYQIVWTKMAQLHLKKVYEYIEKESPKNAFKVLEDIIDAVGTIAL